MMVRQSKAKRTNYRYRRGIPGDYTERDRKICGLHAEGRLSLEAIGETCNPVLSRERVRQIVDKAKRRAAARNSDKMVKLRAAFARGVTGRG
jgi:DNA-directed RNA polymerase sigma subunit (sigma70/sigma32)